MIAIHLLPFEVVVRVIKTAPVALHRLRTQNRVVHHALHTVSVARIAGHAHQVTRQFEVGVRAARRFKRVMGIRQAGFDVVAPRRSQQFIRPPSSRCEALRDQHLVRVFGGAQVLLASKRQVSLHCGRQ